MQIDDETEKTIRYLGLPDGHAFAFEEQVLGGGNFPLAHEMARSRKKLWFLTREES